MAVQTSYGTSLNPAYAGMKYDLNDGEVSSAVNTEASLGMPPGVFVAVDTTDDDGCKLTTASSDVILGLVLKSEEYSKAWTDSAGNVHGELGSSGLLPGAQLSLMTRGRAYVRAEHNYAKGDAIYVRYTSDGGSNTTLGTVSNTSDSGKNRLIAGHWLTTGSAGDIAPIDFDCVGVPS